jgi:hypothetical protein
MKNKQKKSDSSSPWKKPVAVRLPEEDMLFLDNLKSVYGLSQTEAIRMCVREYRDKYNINPKENDHGENQAE